MKSKITLRSVLSAIVCLAILFSFCACGDKKGADVSSTLANVDSDSSVSENLPSQDEVSSQEQNDTETSSEQKQGYAKFCSTKVLT